jgi:hypothetical protein
MIECGGSEAPAEDERVYSVVRVTSLPLRSCSCIMVEEKGVFGSSADPLSCGRCSARVLTVIKTAIPLSLVVSTFISMGPM